MLVVRRIPQRCRGCTRTLRTSVQHLRLRRGVGIIGGGVRLEVVLARVQFVDHGLQQRVGQERVPRNPGLGGAGSEGREHDADGQLECLVEIAAEEIADGGPVGHGLRGADLPFADEVRLRLE